MDDQKTTVPPRRRTYRDRLGRAITDPVYIEARYVQERMRRLMTRNLAAYPERPWYAVVTVGELARAAKLPPDKVVEIVRERIYLGSVHETDGGIETWGVFQDGE